MDRDEPRVPFTIPHGWYAIAYSEELGPGEVLARRYVGSELVAWRSDDGEARVWDAYCPHLGAHLGVGGTVSGDCLVCPFHSWEFGPDGTNTKIPYAERPNRKARVRAYPTVERWGAVLFWYHPDPDVEPLWDPPAEDALEIRPADGGLLTDRSEWEVATAWQEIAENGFDVAHFVSVHGLGEVGQLGDVEWNGPFRRSVVRNQYNTKRGPYEGWQEARSFGPGLGTVRFHIFGDAQLVSMMTPIEADRTHARFAWVYADDEASQATGPRFAAEVRRQFEQDIPIWEHKRFVERPALAPIEKPILDFRRWAAQFYDQEQQ